MHHAAAGAGLALALAVLAVSRVSAEEQGGSRSGVSRSPFGETADGTAVERYTLTNSKGMIAKVTSYGAILTELYVPDKKKRFTDVVLGFDYLHGYLAGHPYFGANAGRVANRIGKGKFTLDGKEYKLATNNGPNSLHGGVKGFDKVMWTPTLTRGNSSTITLTYRSPDGEEGYPGNLTATVTYTLTDKNELQVKYTATTDKATPINLAHHSYFNLAGPGAGDILGHEVTIFADKYTPVDDTLIPTGKIEPVVGTPLDFTTSHRIGDRIAEMKGEPGGYDHNYVLRDGGSKEPALAARVYEPRSGRVMEVLTTQPGLQFYTGNFLDGTQKGKGGIVYKKHAGFCLETQHFPDSVHHPDFPSTILHPGETYSQTTIYRFTVK
jgi:aldose 1-epimerase